ncbi:hypothetical protein EPN42_04735 [bacterium]|nr:MAG: hypothetical protein EPN42_04735 [bacterium]
MLTLDLAIYLMAIILLFSSTGGAIPDAISEVQLTREVTELTNLGNGYASLCNHTNFVCTDVSSGQPLASGAAPIEAGFVSTVPTPPVGAGAKYDIVVTALSSNSADNAVVPYSSAQIDGSHIQNLEAYTVTANGTAPPTVADDGTPKSGTLYTLAYDSCLNGVIATTATTPTSSCS